MSNQVKVSIQISNCCDRVKYITDLLLQARNLGLSETYVILLENLVLDLMPLVSANDEPSVISLYEANLTTIISNRDTAFELWKNQVKNQYTPIPITPSPEP